MADRSRAQRNAAAVDVQPAATFEDLTDDVLIVVIDLLRVRVFFRTEGDETAGKSPFLEAVLVTNLVVEFGKALESGSKVDDFHLESGHSLRHSSNVLNVLNDLE